MKISTKNIFLLIITSIFFISCTTDDIVSKFRSGFPEENMVKLDIPENTKKALNDTSAFYLLTLQTTRDVNYAIINWLAMVKLIISYPATDSGEDSAVWGPWLPDDGLSFVEYKFEVEKNATNGYDYSLSMRTRNPVGSWNPVYTGSFISSDENAFNEGTMSFNFTLASSVDPAIRQSGEISVSYNYSNGGKDNLVSFVDFVDEHGNGPVNADYHYVAASAGNGFFDYEATADIHTDDPDGASYPLKEHLALRSRWTANGAGRTDATVTEGDLPSLSITDYRISECWGNTFSSVYMEEWASFTTADPWNEVKWGEASSCESTMQSFEEPEF
ncbi:hypothetical protein KKF34_06060 [Myxococcota bacterium]|nr:hypothetical protein [Myxococcota bacterium]MBU1382346.1 hypothetical protein [Myxococcota bacterium]MBU1496426.1 hypothetical protein [Myxococcota bacterium]